jgi:hypothetical protein
MSTTTLRIEPSLRERITQLAKALDQTPHNFMLQALAEKADEAEWKLSMQHEAHVRDLSLQAGEPGIEWHEMRAYLHERLAQSPTKNEQSKH